MDETKKGPAPDYGEIRAIGIFLLFLILGFAVIWLARSIVDIEGDAVYVSLLFIPVLVYVIISGRLMLTLVK